MTYKQLLEELQKLTPEQLESGAGVFIDSEEKGFAIDSIEISGEDFYWEHHGDLIGNLEEVKNTFGDEWEAELEDLIKVPAGSVSIMA